jgi:hypothetical protein
MYEEESFDEYKALPPAPDPGPVKLGKDYTPEDPGHVLFCHSL